MNRFHSILAIAAVFTALIAMAFSVDSNLRTWRAQQDSERMHTPPPDPAEELARVQKELDRALELLEESFGHPVDLQSVVTLNVTLTAYSSTKDQCDSSPHITASNKSVRIGIIAVSDDLLEMGISFGQRVLIPGHGLFEVQDRMNPRWRRRVDIWHSDRQAAKLFGKQKGTLLWVQDERKKA